MDLRPLIALAPAALRPVLRHLADWMERTDHRLAALEAATQQRHPEHLQ